MVRRQALTGLVVGGALVIFAACAPTPAQSPLPAPPLSTLAPALILPVDPTHPAPEEVTVTPTDAMPANPTPDPLPADLPAHIASVVRGDLAQRLNIAAEDVVIVSAVRMEMPSGTLGCGPEGGIQNQGLIIGTEIIAEAKGQEYVYRTDGRRLVPCSENFSGATRPIFLSNPASLTPVARPQDRAVADLAQRLEVAVADITVLRTEAVDWPDASLGCARPGMIYAQVITPGHRVILQAGGRTYDYRLGEGRMVLCQN